MAVTRIQLVRWTEKGLIVPVEDNRGRGRVRRYGERNVLETAICRELAQIGLSCSAMLAVMDRLRRRNG